MRLKHAVLLLAAGFILMPTVLWSQPGGFPPGGGGPGGGGAGSALGRANPDQIFDMIAKGQDVIRVDNLDPFTRSMFDRFAARFGITGNQISREQFRESFARIREAAASGQLPQITGNSRFEGNMDRMFDSRFNDLDRNHDGVLSNDELNGHQLQDERDRYDSNGDGFIDLNEYRSYATARMGNMMGGGGQGGRDRDRGAEDPEEPRRPVVYRAGNLPRDFPYASLDESGDKDGQVGLYEWKNAGKRISEFQSLDLNKDGFLTVDEYYRYRRQQMPATTNMSLFGDVPDPATLMARGQSPGRDMRGPGGDMRSMGDTGRDRGMDFRSSMGMDMGRGMYPGMDMMSRDRDRGRDGGREWNREGRGPGGDNFVRGSDGDMRGGREGRGPGGENGMRMSFVPGGGGDGNGMRMNFGPGGGMTPGGPGGMFPGMGGRDRGNGGGFPGMTTPGGPGGGGPGGRGPGGGGFMGGGRGGPGGDMRGPGGGDRGPGSRGPGGGEGGGKRDFGGGRKGGF
jgi:Ca2+-binding EF-hand superfamily protein